MREGGGCYAHATTHFHRVAVLLHFITAQGFARGGASKWRREITGDGRRPASPRPENLGYSRVISSGQSQSQGTSGKPRVVPSRITERGLSTLHQGGGADVRASSDGLGQSLAQSRPISPNLGLRASESSVSEKRKLARVMSPLPVRDAICSRHLHKRNTKAAR